MDTAFIIASAGFHEEAYTCTRLCQDTYTDSRLLEPLVRQAFGEGKRTLLMAAVRSGKAERVSQLLDCGAPVNTEMPWGYEGQQKRSPLQEACRKGHEAVSQLLIDRGADISAKGLLEYACWSGLTSIVQLLIAKDVVSAQKVTNDEMLCYACDGGSESLVRWLIERGASVRAKDKNGRMPLHVLAESASRFPKPGDAAAIARVLIANGADPKAWGDHCQPPLYLTGDVGVARVLIENGCDVSGPLDRALYHSREAVARLLVEHGAALNKSREIDYTPLHRACSRALEGIARLMIEKGASLDTIDSDGTTVLHALCDQTQWDQDWDMEGRYAARSYPRTFANDFDEENAAEDWRPQTKDRAAIARLLLDRGLDVNATCYASHVDDRTPLLMILDEEYAHEGSEAVARLLIERGADVNACDGKNRSVLHIAASRGHKYAADVLAEVEGWTDVDARDAQQRTPLHVACEAGSEPFVRLLLKLGSDVNARDKRGRTPLHLSCQRNHLSIAHLLIDSGSNVLTRDSNGRLPLDAAKAHGNTELTDILTKLVAAATEAASSAGSGSGSGSSSGGNTAKSRQ